MQKSTPPTTRPQKQPTGRPRGRPRKPQKEAEPQEVEPQEEAECREEPDPEAVDLFDNVLNQGGLRDWLPQELCPSQELTFIQQKARKERAANDFLNTLKSNDEDGEDDYIGKLLALYSPFTPFAYNLKDCNKSL